MASFAPQVDWSAEDQEFAELNRRATSLREVGDLDEAVRCLRRADELNREGIRLSPSLGMRLPLYLQRAGRVTEAVARMEELLRMVPTAAIEHPAGSRWSKKDSLHYEAHQYADLYDKLRLIHQREKNRADADRYRALAKEWKHKAAALHQELFMRPSEVGAEVEPAAISAKHEQTKRMERVVWAPSATDRTSVSAPVPPQLLPPPSSSWWRRQRDQAERDQAMLVRWFKSLFRR